VQGAVGVWLSLLALRTILVSACDSKSKKGPVTGMTSRAVLGVFCMISCCKVSIQDPKLIYVISYID
jgi:hypothetical protein